MALYRVFLRGRKVSGGPIYVSTFPFPDDAHIGIHGAGAGRKKPANAEFLKPLTAREGFSIALAHHVEHPSRLTVRP